ncbi:MAG: glycosyltransferase family 2 protein [Pseudoruegeria sp.]
MPMPNLRVIPFEDQLVGHSPRPVNHTSLSERLIADGHLSPEDHSLTVALRQRENISVEEILLSHGLISEHILSQTLAQLWDVPFIDVLVNPLDTGLIDQIGVRRCIRHSFLPWRNVGGGVVIVTSDPTQFNELRNMLPPDWGQCFIAVGKKSDIRTAILRARSDHLVQEAEQKVWPKNSSRLWNIDQYTTFLLFGGLSIGLCFAFDFFLLFTFFWALITLAMLTGLKLAAVVTVFRDELSPKHHGPHLPTQSKLPVVSILVPLFKEKNIAQQLVKQLEQLDYPKELTDILLIVEEEDLVTQTAIEQTDLPSWIDVVKVPKGAVQTKPRALNYALDFCRGSIIGVYDAEDKPDPNQLRAIVQKFYQSAPDVACLQGVLDFYNPRTNWLSRCFTIEYAIWFRLMLPGMTRLGLVIPLGGTTLFFRRNALEKVRGWDAHNVTEDADLGVRLARQGYRAETVNTTTREEANCRLFPWIKQRSRWIKGYAITYFVHMRRPLKLYKDLGPRKFLGIQILFVCSLSQVLLAPLLWSCWFMFFSLPHPLTGLLPTAIFWSSILLFLVSEVIGIIIGIIAVRRKGDRWLSKWVPTLHFYHPLAAFAAYKGFFELFGNPFYWDKTEHGIQIED